MRRGEAYKVRIAIPAGTKLYNRNRGDKLILTEAVETEAYCTKRFGKVSEYWFVLDVTRWYVSADDAREVDPMAKKKHTEAPAPEKPPTEDTPHQDDNGKPSVTLTLPADTSEEAQRELDAQPSKIEPPTHAEPDEAELDEPEEKRKPGGRTIGDWREDALLTLGDNATASEIANAVNATAKTLGYDYHTSAADIFKWREKRSKETGEDTSRKRTHKTEPTLFRASPLPPVKDDNPTLEDLLAVKRLADEEGGLDALADAVEQVKRLADKVGGLEKLSRSIEGLRRLMS